MSGVIDEHGQWERCNVCGDFELFVHADGSPARLVYERPSDEHPHGRDLCAACGSIAEQVKDAPAPELREAVVYCERVLAGGIAGHKDKAKHLRELALREVRERALAIH